MHSEDFLFPVALGRLCDKFPIDLGADPHDKSRPEAASACSLNIQSFRPESMLSFAIGWKKACMRSSSERAELSERISSFIVPMGHGRRRGHNGFDIAVAVKRGMQTLQDG